MFNHSSGTRPTQIPTAEHDATRLKDVMALRQAPARHLLGAALFACVYLSSAGSVQAGVSLNYPGVGVLEDTDLPGIPSDPAKKKADYGDQLAAWAQGFNPPFPDPAPGINYRDYVGKKFDVVLREETAIMEWGNGSTKTVEVLPKQYSIGEEMRDTLFIESMQNAVGAWKRDYLFSASHVQVKKAGGRAERIYDVYEEYAEKYDVNPYQRLVTTNGSGCFSNLFIGQKRTCNVVVGDVILGVSNTQLRPVTKQTLKVELLTIKNAATLANWGVDFWVRTLQESKVITTETSTTLGNLVAAGLGVTGGGLGLVMAPGAIIYSSLDYLSHAGHEKAFGDLVVVYFHLMRYHPEKFSAAVGDFEASVSTAPLSAWNDFYGNICSLGYVIHGGIDSDSNDRKRADYNVCRIMEAIGDSLVFPHSAQYERIRTKAFAVASLMALVDMLDVEGSKFEIVSRVNADHWIPHLRQQLQNGNIQIHMPPTKAVDLIRNDKGWHYRVKFRYNHLLPQDPTVTIGGKVSYVPLNFTTASTPTYTAKVEKVRSLLETMTEYTILLPANAYDLMNQSTNTLLLVNGTQKLLDMDVNISLSLPIRAEDIDYTPFEQTQNPSQIPRQSQIASADVGKTGALMDLVTTNYHDAPDYQQLVDTIRLSHYTLENSLAGGFSEGEKFTVCVSGIYPGSSGLPHARYFLPETQVQLSFLNIRNGTRSTLVAGEKTDECARFTIPESGIYLFGDMSVTGSAFGTDFTVPFDWENTSLATLPASSGTPSPGLGTLNDTGIVWSGHATSGNATTCDPAHPAGQDCRYGRDALAAAGLLQKVGSSALNNGIANGFDYTKISNSGNELPTSAALGSGPNDWACTRDNVTGLIWEVKVDNTAHLRHQSHGYTWYNPASPDGNPGGQGYTYTCGNTLDGQPCNTHTYTQAVNAQGLCGHSDWRMPDIVELEGITDKGRVIPAIDPQFFPNTPSSHVWSGSPFAIYSSYAWLVSFNDGVASYYNRNNYHQVRLVRGGQCF